MDSLIVESKDVLNVFDRGYLDYKKFDDYCQKGIRFVTRLKDKAIVEVIESQPVKPDSPVKKDMIVRLGTNQKKMKYKLRLIEVDDTKGKLLRIITNDFDLNSEEIGDIYRYQWQINSFLNG